MTQKRSGIKKIVPFITSAVLMFMFSGCGPTDGQRLMQEGASPEYAQGFDDGCSSGKKAAGDMFSLFHKNVQAYRSTPDYRQGWDDGHEECKSEWLSNYRQQQLGIERQRAYDEHQRLEKMNDRDMVRDAMPDLSRKEIDQLKTLGK